MALNDSLDGLAEVGTETGNFLENIGPGLAYILILLTVIVALASILGAVAMVIVSAIKRR